MPTDEFNLLANIERAVRDAGIAYDPREAPRPVAASQKNEAGL